MNRSPLQVVTSVKTLFRLMEDLSEASLYSASIASGGSAVREAFCETARLPEAVTRFLVEMDKKLDILVGRFQQESLSTHFPSQGRFVALSATGATLQCREPLAPGDCLELILVLQEFPFVSVVCRAMVVSSLADSVYAVAFQSVEEDDKERLIQFIFQEERRHIRSAKVMN
ncbi:PilZ domain-containing protein [Desulfovibrio cuneatus]|uniref:PilZ domain-containing protein n=1 Tax=Desulfovibrio cuneatus TaxID=159728 RepID=UPI0004250279|nr:PilZ domain-containing protein [Desulfovibrio cuneatus]